MPHLNMLQNIVENEKNKLIIKDNCSPTKTWKKIKEVGLF